MPKNTSTPKKLQPHPTSLHHLQPQFKQRDVDVHSRFQPSQNQLHKVQNNETQKYDELYKNNPTQQLAQQQN